MALPDSVREVIGARVGRLGADAERVLSVAAVIGRDFDLDVLARAAQTSEDDVLDILDAAAAAALVREIADTGRYTFAHALIQHTLYEELGPTRRARAHRQVAEALEELCGDRPGSRVGELAAALVSAPPNPSTSPRPSTTRARPATPRSQRSRPATRSATTRRHSSSMQQAGAPDPVLGDRPRVSGSASHNAKPATPPTAKPSSTRRAAPPTSDIPTGSSPPRWRTTAAGSAPRTASTPTRSRSSSAPSHFSRPNTPAGHDCWQRCARKANSAPPSNAAKSSPTKRSPLPGQPTTTPRSRKSSTPSRTRSSCPTSSTSRCAGPTRPSGGPNRPATPCCSSSPSPTARPSSRRRRLRRVGPVPPTGRHDRRPARPADHPLGV